MDKREFAIFADALRTYYPKEQILPNAQAMELWFRELQDVPYQVAEATLRKWVATNKWSPSIAEIREMAVTVCNGDPLTFGESWERVRTAIRRFGYYRPQEAMDSLDPLTRRCVESLGFRELCMSENEVADRANFRMVFETMQKREQFEKQLPPKLLAAIESIQLKGLDDSPKLEGVIADVPKLCES